LTAAATGWSHLLDTSFGISYSAQSPRYLKLRETVMSANVMRLERFSAGQVSLDSAHAVPTTVRTCRRTNAARLDKHSRGVARRNK